MTALSLLASLLLSGPAAPAAHLPPPARGARGQRVEIVVRFPPWEFTGTFTLAGAGLSDRGVARDRGALTGPEAMPVERVLAGDLGTITLSLRAQPHRASFPALFGRWQVTGATGAYRGLAGGGGFTATDLGTGRGSPLELQALIGRVTRPGGAPAPRRAPRGRPPPAPRRGRR